MFRSSLDLTGLNSLFVMDLLHFIISIIELTA
jgi:hypothetical protein